MERYWRVYSEQGVRCETLNETQPYLGFSVSEGVMFLQVPQHVGGVSSLTRHFQLAQFTCREAVIFQLAFRVYKILKVFPDSGTRRFVRGEVPECGSGTFLRRGVVRRLVRVVGFLHHFNLEHET